MPSHDRFPLRSPRLRSAEGSEAASLAVACSKCNLRELCLPVGLDEEAMRHLDRLVKKRRRIARGAPLFRTGDPFTGLYAIRAGLFKTRVVTGDGRDQVTGFQMAGEIVGLDGIVEAHHTCDAIALETAEVCELPFDRVTELSRHIEGLQHHVHRILSREIVRDQGVMILLGSMRADQRVATFLLNLVERLHVRGFSPTDFVLRMSREEIGSYLGLTLETVSRTFSRLAADGVIEIRQRHVRILLPEAMRQLASPQPAAVAPARPCPQM